MKQEIQTKPIKVINTRSIFNSNLDSIIDPPEYTQRVKQKNKNHRESEKQRKYARMARDYYCGF